MYNEIFTLKHLRSSAQRKIVDPKDKFKDKYSPKSIPSTSKIDKNSINNTPFFKLKQKQDVTRGMRNIFDRLR